MEKKIDKNQKIYDLLLVFLSGSERPDIRAKAANRAMTKQELDEIQKSKHSTNEGVYGKNNLFVDF
jgi:hypothetical protein